MFLLISTTVGVLFYVEVASCTDVIRLIGGDSLHACRDVCMLYIYVYV